MSSPQHLRSMVKSTAIFAVMAGTMFSSSLSIIHALLLLFILYIITCGTRFLRLFILTGYRDATALYRLLKTKYMLYRIQKQGLSVPKIFMNNVKAHPNRIALRHRGCDDWTFADLDRYSNKVANAMLKAGFQSGDELALIMSNRPEYVGIWLGLAKAGLVTALINTNLRASSLIHSISVVNCKGIIFDAENSESIRDVLGDLNKNKSMLLYCLDEFDPVTIPARPLHTILDKESDEQPNTVEKTNCKDKLFYIYTSGTTGLPKAAIIKQYRYIWMGGALRNMIAMDKNKFQGNRPKNIECDNIYTCLPLYHLAAGCLGTCQSIIFGDSISLAKKFSASRFWIDCKEFECTSAQYIGEICRYLLAQPEKETDRQHQVTLMFGNGLRPKIWSSFVKRFGIHQIGEFYGSTEGNTNVINTDNREGACGFISLMFPKVYPVCLIRLDPETNLPLRDSNGMAIHCKEGESGEFVGKIIQSDPTRSFDGYVNQEATEKKIIRNVFAKGDMAFLSGDLLTMDELGYVYFKDRTGDTFRWKGENVSTAEVESVISSQLKQADSIVFGVEIKDCEGRAGMAVINAGDNAVDLDSLAKGLLNSLPRFAIPVFIRLVKQVEMTGTFKMPKNQLQKEAYDFTQVTDPLFYLDGVKMRYIQINEQVYQDLLNGNIKL